MRSDQITFTRFIAAVAIVILHFGESVYPFNKHVLNPFIAHINLGVSYFFILSGFVMIIAYYNRQNPQVSSTGYYINRVARIFPLYLFALFLVVIQYAASGYEIKWQDVVLGSLGIHAWYPPSSFTLNFPGWSLSVELFFYALFPLLLNRFYSTFSLRKVALIVGVIWLLSQVFINAALVSPFYKGELTNSYFFLFYFPLLHLNQFLVGNLAGLYVMQLTKGTSRNYDLLILSILLLFLALVKADLHITYHNGLLAVLFVPLIVLITLNRGYITQLFSKKAFVFLGEISFGIYILQYPVYLFCIRVFESAGIQSKSLIFYLYLLILLLVSAICYRLIEVPARNKIKEAFTKKAKPVALKV